jgi:WhiB family transcriptional regulator, redox-sensing transcriptional regulator
MTEQHITEPAITENNWRQFGACYGKGDLFFSLDTEDSRPGETTVGKRNREIKAKAICKPCPVVVFCRETSLDRKETHGVWGGFGESERADILKKRNRGQ